MRLNVSYIGPMREDSCPQLDSRLKAYAATAHAPAIAHALKRSAEKWPIYAAVTSAALAMASNASASIIYSGIIDVTAAAPTPGPNQRTGAIAGVPLKNASGGLLSRSFFFDDLRGHASGNDSKGVKHFTQFGFGFIGGSNVRLLVHSGAVRRLSSSGLISGAGNTATGGKKNGFLTGSLLLGARASYRTALARTGTVQGGWTRTEGFAAFSFNPGGGTDYGWIRLQFTIGGDGGLDSLTTIDWAYQNDGGAILAGDTGISGTPEPSTAGLMLLAAGAAGVGALRKRREAAR
jgi:hypothetical protein